MATKSVSRPSNPPRRAKEIPIRRIGHEDLSIALRQGLDDFLTFRGDIVFAGIVYTLIGIAAVVMTTSAPLMPFFFPVVAGVGLLGPLAAVGFYELAKRREEGQPNLHWFNFLDVRKRPGVDDMGIVAGMLLAIFAAWLVAAGVLYAALFGWATPTSITGFFTEVFLTPRGWALIVLGAAIGAIFGSAVPLAQEISETWQYAVLAGAALALLVLRRGVVSVLVTAALVGVAVTVVT